MTPKFTRTSIPEKEPLGEKLSKKRAALGFDIKETERQTKIRAKHIECLESGDYDNLPPDVYVRGFLKNYAKFLKLDSNKVISLYLKERGLAENVKRAVAKKQDAPKPKFKAPKLIITPKRITLTSIAVGLIIVVAYIGWEVSLLTAPPKLEVLTPQDKTKIESDTIIVSGITDPGADIFVNKVAISVDPEGNFKEKISLQKDYNLIRIESKNKLGRARVKTLEVISAPKEAVVAQAPINTNLEMKIDIGPKSAMLYIEVDGKPLSDKNAVMLPGSSQLLSAKEKIIITASDGGCVNIILNGKDLGKLGASGVKIKDKLFNKDSLGQG